LMISFLFLCFFVLLFAGVRNLEHMLKRELTWVLWYSLMVRTFFFFPSAILVHIVR
jgi:hypothetical protein